MTVGRPLIVRGVSSGFVFDRRIVGARELPCRVEIEVRVGVARGKFREASGRAPEGVDKEDRVSIQIRSSHATPCHANKSKPS